MPAKNLIEMNQAGQTYAKEVLGKVDFKLLGLPNDQQFKETCTVILVELARAYCEGYSTGVEDQRRRK